MKKYISIILMVVLLFSFSSCATKENDPDEQTSVTVNGVQSDSDKTNGEEATEVVTEIVTEVVTDDEGNTEIVSEVVTEIVKAESSSKEKTTKKKDTTTKKKETTTNVKKPVADKNDDPSEWTKEEVVAYYKAACEKSSYKKSVQTMSMRKNTLKAGGGIGKFLSVAEPIIRGVLELNSTEIDGITGGYWNLVPSDCKTAKAYKSGDYTVVEMTMVDQTDGVYGKKFEGTVAHAITVVDGVAEAAEQFPAFDIKYKEADIKIHYTDAKLKVKINDKGIIEKGTWSYVVTPVVNDLYIENLEVDNAGAIVDYKVTVGGGF
ncbi:MAG: hypothetical protein IJ279_04445 [Clostridia bacterium]|nr:hypothetical protein [Clostridia bacterium]